jgi:hypothetical protein
MDITRMAIGKRRERVAIGFGPERLRLLIARGNGTLEVRHEDAEELPEGATNAGLRSPAFHAPDAVEAALRRLVERARVAGHLAARPELVCAVISDGAVKIGLAPIQGELPSRTEGEQMARWVLKDLLPIDSDQARVDWAVLREPSEGGAHWLVGMGADADRVREVEEMVARFGLKVGRVVPWSFAAAVSAGEASEHGLTLCEGDGALSCLFEVDGIPRFHRAWRAAVEASALDAELSSLQRYVADRLEMTAARAVLCGDDRWRDGAASACAVAGLTAVALTPAEALTGALAL